MKPCSCRGRVHQPRECPAYGLTCRACRKVNHFARVCRWKQFNKDQYSRDGTLNTEEARQWWHVSPWKPHGQQIAWRHRWSVAGNASSEWPQCTFQAGHWLWCKHIAKSRLKVLDSTSHLLGFRTRSFTKPPRGCKGSSFTCRDTQSSLNMCQESNLQ